MKTKAYTVMLTPQIREESRTILDNMDLSLSKFVRDELKKLVDEYNSVHAGETQLSSDISK
jgi:hypothetical protein